MARRRAAHKRDIFPDAKYGDVVLHKFINCMMCDGKKSVAERVVYAALETAAGKADLAPAELFGKVLESVAPAAEVRSRRVGGATYQIPVEVKPERGRVLAITWLINAARKRNEQTMTERLSQEFLDALNNRGQAMKTREDAHRMAEANRAFSHYRW